MHRSFFSAIAHIAVAILFGIATGFAQAVGTWAGRLELPGGQNIEVRFNVSESDDGTLAATLDSPDQGAIGLPTSSVRGTADSLIIEAEALGMSFAGQYAEDGQRLDGTFAQGPGRLPLSLQRADTAEAAAPPRPQVPTDFPYDQEEVTVQAGAHTLAGTLTAPTDGKPTAVVALVSGSGPSDRDETVFGHKPFLVLSDHLTRQGIAVLRYDDRGVGESTGDHDSATSADLADDAAAVARYLRQRPEFAGLPVGLIGHSEGGMLVPMANASAGDALVDFAVLLAPPGIAIDSLLLLQIDRGAELQGAPEAVRTANRNALRKSFAYLRDHPELDSAAAHDALTQQMVASLAGFPQEVYQSIEDPEGFARKETAAFVGPWFRYFIAYDPAANLRQLDVPTLALFGELDAQVTPVENAEGVRRVLPQGEHTAVETLPGLNHLFQPATTGGGDEYARIETTMAPAALERIATWIAELPR